MPTWRKLHVKTTESQSVQELPDDFHRLLWVLLPLGLDREGRGIFNPAWIKSKVMPLRVDVTSERIFDAMMVFVDRGMVETYTVNGRDYFWVPTFPVYQGNTSKEAPSHLPEPPDPDQPPEDDWIPFEIPRTVQPGEHVQLRGVFNQMTGKYESVELRTNSGPTPDQLPSGSTTDADADADSDSDADDKPGAAKPDPKAGLLLEQTAGGRVLQKQMAIARESKGRAPFRYYANQQQRDAFLVVYDQLGDKLKPLIVKGLTRQRESLTNMLAWLQECARREKPKKTRRTQSAEQTLKQLEETK
jgi:hypothetical protein